MQYFSTILFAVVLVGCQSEKTAAPQDEDSTNKTLNAPAQPRSQSVEEKLTGMDAMVVPHPNGGIKSVIFEGTTVSKEALDLVVASPELEVLSLSGTSVGDAEVKRVGKLKNLKVLLLGGTQITDEGLVHIKSLAKLQRLGLGGTQITDVGLDHAKELKSLKTLFLGETQVTDVGVAAFQQALPDCQIER